MTTLTRHTVTEDLSALLAVRRRTRIHRQTAYQAFVNAIVLEGDCLHLLPTTAQEAPVEDAAA